MLREITSLAEITPKKGWVHIFDIDDTLIVYEKINKKWWQDQEKCCTHIEAVKKWRDLIQHIPYTHTDKTGYDIIYKRIHDNGDKIVLLSLRSDELYDCTIKHLENLGILYDDIYLIGGKNKGKKILEICVGYTGVIFIDDSIQNLRDAIEKITIPLECYLKK